LYGDDKSEIATTSLGRPDNTGRFAPQFLAEVYRGGEVCLRVMGFNSSDDALLKLMQTTELELGNKRKGIWSSGNVRTVEELQSDIKPPPVF
jgi:hypothetical protein